MQVSSDTDSALASVAIRATQSPGSAAVVEPCGTTYTYAQLWRQVAAIHSQLSGMGVRSQDTVAVLVPQGSLAVIAVAGVMGHCCCAPLNPSFTLSEIESHLTGMRVAAILLSPEFASARSLALSLGIGVLTASSGNFPDIAWQSECATRLPESPVAPDAAVLLNTSATTGAPKLVPLTHANLLAMFENTCRALVLTSNDRLLLVTPVFHAQGIVSTFAQFSAGGAVIATPGFEAASYRDWLRELRPTWYTAAPAIHQAVASLFESRPLKEPTSLRFVRSSGAAFTMELREQLQRALGVPVLNGYGMSETGAVASDALDPRLFKPNSVGRSVGPGIAIMAPDGRLLPPNSEGEVVVSGPSVMRGYANHPEANLAAFRDGRFRTGDLGRLDSDGFLFVTGRSKEMINRGGQKIVPEDVDRVLGAHPAIREAVAFGVPHPTLGEDIACAVIPHSGAATSEAELRRFAGQKLTSFKVPRRVYFVEEIPRGDTGKPKRHLLATQIAAARAEAAVVAAAAARASLTASPSGQFDPESDPNARRLVEIWARILKRDDVDLAEDFFSAGGDSLGAVNLLAEIDLRFGADLQASAASFLDTPTLMHLHALLRQSHLAPAQENASSEIEVFPVTASASNSAIFCVPGDGDEGLYFRRLARHLEGTLALSIVRPANTWHEQTVFSIEDSACRTAQAIVRAQPSGPYVVGGYCYGGIVAFATAQELRRQGHPVRVVLFDVPMPGFPTPLRGCGSFLRRAASEFRQLRRRSGLASPGVNVRRLIRRGIWFSVLPLRGIAARYAKFAAIRWAVTQAQHGYLPLYRPTPIDAPVLHFLSLEEGRPIRSASRLGWRRMARESVSEQWVPLNHDRHFRESNLPEMAQTLLAWLAVKR